MVLTKARKEDIIESVRQLAESSSSLVVAHYTGVDAPLLTKFRAMSRDASLLGDDAHLAIRVIPNKLAKRAFSDTNFQVLSDHLKGQMIFIFSQSEACFSAKLVSMFNKEHDALEVIKVAVGETLYDAKDLKFVASLPTKPEALGMVAATLKAPVSNMACLLSQPVSKMARAFGDYRSKATA